MKFRGRLILAQLEAFLYYKEVEGKTVVTNKELENFVAFIYPELPKRDSSFAGNLEKERIRHAYNVKSSDSPMECSDKNILRKHSSSSWSVINDKTFYENGILIDRVMDKVNKAKLNGNKVELKQSKRVRNHNKENESSNKVNNKRVLIKNESITYARNPKVVEEAKKLADYKCEINSLHAYVVKEDGKVYTHGHHLIPMSYQDNFENNLDVVENICVLCNVDHDVLHHGRKVDKIELLGILYYKKIEGLKNNCIDITFEELLKMYNVL